MESHLINLVTPPINPVPRGRSNTGQLSGSSHISLTSADRVSLNCGHQLCKMGGEQNLCHPKIISRHIISTIRRISLGICYYDYAVIRWWRSGFTFPTCCWNLCAHEKAITYIWDYSFSKCIPCEYVRNVFEKNIHILPCNCQCIIKLIWQSLMA